MESEIQTYVRTSRALVPITIFGYTSKGIPGLEITGLGKFSKTIREKFIYLSRVRELKIPKRKYILCVEVDELIKDCSWAHIKWFEFPLLLTYWHLAGIIKINKLSDCISSGHVNSMGNIYYHPLNNQIENELREKLIKRNIQTLKYIGGAKSQEFYNIDASNLMQDIPRLKFISKEC